MTNSINSKINTLCYSINIFENDNLNIFTKIIDKTEEIFSSTLNKNIKYNNTDNKIHLHYEINNILFEIKLIKKYDSLIHKDFIQCKLKIFTQENDNLSKITFNKLCDFCTDTFVTCNTQDK